MIITGKTEPAATDHETSCQTLNNYAYYILIPEQYVNIPSLQIPQALEQSLSYAFRL